LSTRIARRVAQRGVVGHPLGVRMRPVGAPEEPLRRRSQQRAGQVAHAQRVLLVEAEGRGQLHPAAPGLQQVHHPAPGRMRRPVAEGRLRDMVEDDLHRRRAQHRAERGDHVGRREDLKVPADLRDALGKRCDIVRRQRDALHQAGARADHALILHHAQRHQPDVGRHHRDHPCALRPHRRQRLQMEKVLEPIGGRLHQHMPRDAEPREQPRMVAERRRGVRPGAGRHGEARVVDMVMAIHRAGRHGDAGQGGAGGEGNGAGRHPS
jgi:hypothetical protein